MLSNDDRRHSKELRIQLLFIINQHIADNNLNQDQAATKFGVAQSTICKLKKGETSHCSLEVMAKMVVGMGYKLEVKKVKSNG